MHLSLLALGLFALGGLMGCERPVPPAEIRERLAALGRPNLVLIVVDTLRADWTTPYGFEQDTSPELDAWARRGVLFERVRAQSSWTKISMASLMTSLWPRSHGIPEAQDGLAESAVTLAEVLRDAGYATYGVQTNGWLHQSFGFHQGFDRYMFPKGGGHPRLGQPSLWPHADRVYEEAVRLLDAHDRKRPFFLYLHFMDVHEYAAPPSFKTFGTDSKGAYLAAIRWVDDAMRRVREKLTAAGYGEQTVMVFAADHGETFGEHGVHGHARNVLTPVVWVPLVFRFPFRVEPVRIATQVRNVDIAPTLLDLAGFRVPELRGSIAGAVADRRRHRARSSLLRRPRRPPLPRRLGAVGGHRRGLDIRPQRDPPEDDDEAYEGRAVAPGAEFLFDRRVDPGENVNLIAREPAEAVRLRQLLDRHLDEEGAGVVERGVRIDPGIADRLRAMGYLR